MVKPLALFQLIRDARALQASGNLGDFAIRKADALGAKASPVIEAQLGEVSGYHPPIDLTELGQLPPDSFGNVYAQHMLDNQLQPFNISQNLSDVARRNTFALRYAVTHDIFHVLLGFDTSYAGEMGVLAFAVAQGYSPQQKLALRIASWLYPLLAPRQRQQIAAARKQGSYLGQNAKMLLSFRFEDHWLTPITQLRSMLNLPDPSLVATDFP